MLKLERVFDLRVEVPQRVPLGQKTSPTGDVLTGESMRIRLVGREKEGVLLIARLGYDPADGGRRTYIDSYDVRTKDLKPLYMHDAVMNCVGCTVNADRSLLAFTKLDRRKGEKRDQAKERLSSESLKDSTGSGLRDSTSGSEEVFESALAEILPKGECYSLNIQSTRPQRVQFVHTEAKFSNLLFILEREFVHLYQILTRKRNNGGVRVGAQPLLDASISKQFAWYEWDGRRDLLYLLSNKPKEEGNAHIFRVVQIQKSHKLVCEIPIILSTEASNPDMTPFNVADELALFGYDRPLAAGSREFSLLSLVRPLRGNALCLCQQIISLAIPGLIHVTVFMLHCKGRVDLTLSLPEVPLEQWIHTRVVFEIIADILVVWVPGHYLHLLDCSDDHELCLNLRFTSAEHSTRIPIITSPPPSSSPSPMPSTPASSSSSPHTPPPSDSESNSGNSSNQGSLNAIPINSPPTSPMAASSLPPSSLMQSANNIGTSVPSLVSPLAARPFASGTYLLSTSLGDSLSAYPSPGASPAHSPTPASAAASTSPQLHSHLVRQSTYPRGLPASLGLPSFAGASYRILSLDLLVLPPGSAADAKKGFVYECRTGVMYEVSMCRDALVRFFTQPITTNVIEQQLLQAMHLSVIHMQDLALREQIMASLRTSTPHNLTAPLLRELLIATSYLNAAKDPTADPSVLRLWPVTSLPPLKKVGAARRGGFLRFTHLSGYSVVLSKGKLAFIPANSTSLPAALPSFQPERAHWSPGSDSASSSPGGRARREEHVTAFARLGSALNRFFYGSDAPEGPEPETDAETYVDATVDYLLACLPRESRTRLSQYARTYRRAQQTEVDIVFQLLLPLEAASGPALALNIMENLFCALEEQNLPFPRGFSSKFSELGLRCLPRNLFLQYLDRGVFVLDEPLARLVANLPGDAADDAKFKLNVVGRLKEPRVQLELMGASPPTFARPHVDLLLELLCPSPPLADGAERDAQYVDMENFSAAEFTPLAVWLDALRTRHPDHPRIPALIEYLESSMRRSLISSTPHSPAKRPP